MNTLTFIVPGLLDPVPYLDQLPVSDLPELPVFSKMLSRGEFSSSASPDNSENNFYRCLIKELISNNNPDSTVLLPSMAGLAYYFDSQFSLDNKWIMRADPSFMAVDRDQLVLAQTGSLDITIEEAKKLADEINLFFNDFDEEKFWTLEAVSPDRWYIISDKPIRLHSIPPEKVLGQSIKSFLFSNIGESHGNEDSSHWLSLFNEFQMILHQSDINKKRIAEKKAPINSLWFWGAGKSIESSVDYSALSLSHAAKTVYSDNHFAQGLSQLNKYRCSSLPEKYELLNHDKSEQQVIYTIEHFSQAIQNKDIFSWVGLLEQFEHHYLTLLVQDLYTGKLDQVEFICPSGTKLLLTKKLLKRWWKKKHQYYSFLSTDIHFKE